MELNKIYHGDALEVLKTFPNESVDCIVTSPPYFGLRDYGEETKTIWGGNKDCRHKWESKILPHPTRGKRDGKGIYKDPKYKAKGSLKSEYKSDFCQKCGAWYGQLGLEPTLDMYLDHMLQITAELKRVLKKTGTMWWNHGDSYASIGKLGGDFGQDGKISKGFSGRGRIPKGTYPEKSLLLQNYRLAQRMVDEQQWILRNVVIWYKPNCMPQSVKDRFTVDFEPVFFFTKNKKYWFEQQFESYDKPLNRWGGEKLKANGESEWDKGVGQNMYRDRDMRPNQLGRNKRCVWQVPTQPFKDAHFATFPEKLIEPMIKAGCPEFICRKCGKAREKIFVDVGEKTWKDTRKKGKHLDTGTSGLSFGRTAPIEVRGYTDCGCNAGWTSGIVLDPFMGSGTTAVIARKFGRNFVGIELNPNYVKIAEKRLSQLTLL